jgi:hypothetical protein
MMYENNKQNDVYVKTKTMCMWRRCVCEDDVYVKTKTLQKFVYVEKRRV